MILEVSLSITMLDAWQLENQRDGVVIDLGCKKGKPLKNLQEVPSEQPNGGGQFENLFLLWS